jgi:two-component system sensor histidine kinase KdpD
VRQYGAIALKIVLAIAVIAAVTVVAKLGGANAATVGFAYLIAVLAISIWGGLAVGLIASVVATGCYNFYFLPPFGTFTIQDPANWIALAAFFVASLVASRLVVNARMQAERAETKQRELEALYALSVDLFAATSRVGALTEATTRVLTNVGAEAGGLVLFGNSTQAQEVVCWTGEREEEAEDLIAGVGRHREPLEFPSRSGRDVYLPLNVGGRVGGVLVVRRSNAALGTLKSVAALVALAVERERFLSERAHLHALRESDALKTSLLRAVSHDLATPLTSIALAVGHLRDVLGAGSEAQPILNALAEESDRLRRRIENLMMMARLEAGKSVPRPEPSPPADLFHAAREHLSLIGQRRAFDVEIDDDCPDVFVDPVLAVEILVNLIENADRVSPAGAPIQLVARRHPVDSAKVRLEVLDRGPGITRNADEPGDVGRTGLGLEIARSLAAANRGEVSLTNRADGGAAARLDLPAATVPVVT